MHVTNRRTLAIIVAGLALLPLGHTQAMQSTSSHAILLRYHFVSGQRYAYRVTGSLQSGAGGSNLLAALSAAVLGGITGSTAMTGTVRYHVVRVDADGGADIAANTGAVTSTVTKDGTTTTSVDPPAATSRIHVGADGTTKSTLDLDMQGVALAVLGTLPHGPVAPGAHWSSTAAFQISSAQGAGLAPVQVSVQNVFSRVVTANGQRAAVIDGAGTPHYSFDLTTTNGSSIHVNVAGTLSSHSLFGLTAHRLISSRVITDLKISLGQHRRKLFGGANGGGAFTEHLDIDVSPSA